MTLLSEYQYTGTPDGQELTNRIAAALYKAATDMVLVSDPQSATYKSEMRFAKVCLNATAQTVVFITRALISQGLSNAATDTQISNTIDTNYQKLANLYDPDLEI